MTFAHSLVIETDKEIYAVEEEITVTLQALQGEANEWLALFPAESDNDFGNIVTWQLTGSTVNAEVTLNAPSRIGNYEVRVFHGANFVPGGSKQISVNAIDQITTVETTKQSYLLNEAIVAIYDNVNGEAQNWIGLYPATSNNDWENVLDWDWIRDGRAGSTQFDALAPGEYEVRVFYNNSFVDEAKYAFSVEGPPSPDIMLRKASFDPYELIHVEYVNFGGLATDWIGIFPVGADDQKESAIAWRDTKSLVNGELSFNGLPAGAYEARAYFDQVHQKTVPFNVDNKVVERVLYDDFEDATIDPRWTVASGRAMTLLNVGVDAQGVASGERKMQVTGKRSLRTYRDYRGGLNYASYYFNFENPAQKFKFLELDMKIGESSHVFSFGVKMRTKFGDRRIEFASYLNHTMPSGQQIIRGPYGNVLPGHREAFAKADGYLHVHPGPTDYYVGTSGVGEGSGMFIYYKINIEEKLRVLEPDNELLGITYFVVTGGDYDNLALTTH